MFPILSVTKFFIFLSLALSPSLCGEVGDVVQKLEPWKGNIVQRRDIFDQRLYRETTEGYVMPSYHCERLFPESSFPVLRRPIYAAQSH